MFVALTFRSVASVVVAFIVFVFNVVWCSVFIVCVVVNVLRFLL